jgi:hypothetical protein
MKIYIDNETGEPVKLLREVTKLVAKERGLTHNIKMKYTYAKRRRFGQFCISGRASVGLRTFDYLNSDADKAVRDLHWCHNITMLITPTWKENLEIFLQIFMHEIDHTLGLNHRDMVDYHLITISDKLLTDIVVKIKEFYPDYVPSGCARQAEIEESIRIVGQNI